MHSLELRRIKELKPKTWMKSSVGEITTCLQVNFEAVHNIDEWGSDFVPSMREALRCWNMTVRISLMLEYHQLATYARVASIK